MRVSIIFFFKGEIPPLPFFNAVAPWDEQNLGVDFEFSVSRFLSARGYVGRSEVRWCGAIDPSHVA